MRRLKVLVLGGGPNRERPVSLRSAAAVAGALREAGHEVVEADVSPTDAAALATPCDVVFPVLHGRFGEGGELQRMLEARGLRYVGARPEAASAAMDKRKSKRVAERCGIPTPDCQLLGAETELALDAPLVLKPVAEGSSFGIAICRTRAEADAARRELHGDFENLLAERFVAGFELTVGIVGRELLPPIRITPKAAFYDFEAKYDRDDTDYSFEIDLSDGAVEPIRRGAWAVFEALGCRHLARVDFLVDDLGAAWFLEINTMPGFTEHSLLPMAARRAGMEMPALCDHLVRLALEADDGR